MVVLQPPSVSFVERSRLGSRQRSPCGRLYGARAGRILSFQPRSLRAPEQFSTLLPAPFLGFPPQDTREADGVLPGKHRDARWERFPARINRFRFFVSCFPGFSRRSLLRNDTSGGRCGGLSSGSSHPAGSVVSKKKKLCKIFRNPQNFCKILQNLLQNFTEICRC